MLIKITKLQKSIFAFACLLFFLFIGFSYLVHKNLFTHFDFDTTIRLQDHMSRRVDGPFSILSYIGSFEITAIILLIFLAFRRKINGIIIFLSFAIFHVFELYGKTFVNHLPPPHFMLRTENIGNFPQFYVRTENSYPSGHSARALFLTTVLVLFTANNKKLDRTQKIIIYILLALYDIVMLISRIYLGEHWASDVIGGSLLGVSFAVFSFIFINNKSKQLSPGKKST